jgi:membrane protein required for colicin V production
MNGFDLALIAIVGLSMLFAFARGVVRELIALSTWVTAFVVAIAYAGSVAPVFGRLDIPPAARQVLAFVLLLVAVLIVGALIARLLSGVVRAIGLGFVDRTLGAVFGLARGFAVLVAFALVAGVTALPKRDWWQNSTLGPPLGAIALSLRPYLPRAWADRLDFAPDGTISARLGIGTAGVPGRT